MNPSTTWQRATIETLSLTGLAMSIVCILHASGAVPFWEPFPTIEHGLVLQAPPVPLPELDVAGFAAISATAALGRRDRWRSMPAMALATGAATLVTATSLLVRWSWQYFALGRTSTLFIALTVLGVAMLPMVADEVYAATLRWRPLATKEAELDSSTGAATDARISDWPCYLAGGGGIVLGILLLLAPVGVLSSRAAQHSHLLGAFVAAIGALALAQVARPARWLNAGVGLWLLVAPLALGYALRGMIYSMVIGLLLMIVSAAFAERAPGSHARYVFHVQ